MTTSGRHRRPASWRGGLAILTGLAATLAILVPTVRSEAEEPPIDFQSQIRGLLSDRCFACHGPDAGERQAGLRLDEESASRMELESGNRAIVPGDPDASALVHRIFANDPVERMPPADFSRTLSDAERNLLKSWIAQGARYDTHWAFRSPQAVEPPSVQRTDWPRNAIDRFILARLEAEGLAPSAEADRMTLIRRVTLDLTGLPPTPAEVAAFLADTRPDAYEHLVERLFATDAYAERMTVDWLDVARFADTHGYHIDSGRDMTAWRDWVIRAFAENLSYDRFTIDQLAGDLVPNATLEQQIASGFHRNHMINFEGGAIPEEYHHAYIVDRVNTTGTVFLGMSLACAQCHDHKYDPISQEEYYRLFAYFNNVPEKGLDGNKGNAAPVLPLPSPEHEAKSQALAAQIAAIDQRLTGEDQILDSEQAGWEASILAAPTVEWVTIGPSRIHSLGGAQFKSKGDGSFLAVGTNPERDTYEFVFEPPTNQPITAIRLEALTDLRMKKRTGRSSNGNFVLSEFEAYRVSSSDPAVAPGSGEDARKPISWARAAADYSQANYDVTLAIDGDPNTGWAVDGNSRLESRSALFVPRSPIEPEPGMSVLVRIRFESQFSQHTIGRPRLSVTTHPNPTLENGLPREVLSVLDSPSESRGEEQRRIVRDYFRSAISEEARKLRDERQSLAERQRALEADLPTTMVMREMPEPRDTFIRIRGQYDILGEKVKPATPAFLPPLPEGVPNDRLGLAHWLVSPEHPLTTRVAVNRFWQSFFGNGLVATPEDFGSQGERPSHPELLDWLAVRFRNPAEAPGESAPAGSWDVRALVRLMVTSATYRQTSLLPPELRERDPENRLLARTTRSRLQAEFLRDQALFVSGLLDRRVGGASVFPYQPPGLWEELASREDGKNWTAQSYTPSSGRDLYRRTMYTFWKRTSPPPSLATFDAPDRETCTVRRSRTNTPLQALVLMNDPTYVEAARHLAQRLLTEGPSTTGERIVHAYRLVLARPPTPRELEIVSAYLARTRERFQTDAEEVDRLLAVGESPVREGLDRTELAVWTLVSSLLLNLDEAVTKG